MAGRGLLSFPFVVHAVESRFLQDGDRYHKPDTSSVANYTVKHGLTTSRVGRGGKVETIGAPLKIPISSTVTSCDMLRCLFTFLGNPLTASPCRRRDKSLLSKSFARVIPALRVRVSTRTLRAAIRDALERKLDNCTAWFPSAHCIPVD